MKRLYLIPVRDSCNANCTFCYMKEKKKDFFKPQFINYSKLEKTVDRIDDFDEVEITGGGEPLLHKEIQKIVNLFEDKYVKLYTNGFLLKKVFGIDELNISRVHWDSKINNYFYRSNFQNKLGDVLNFYRPFVKKIRLQTILIRGAIDNKKKMEEFVSLYEDKVDVFMFRELFTKCNLDKEKFVDYFKFNHPKVIFDKTLDNYERDLYFIGTDSKIYDHFQY